MPSNGQGPHIQVECNLEFVTRFCGQSFTLKRMLDCESVVPNRPPEQREPSQRPCPECRRDIATSSQRGGQAVDSLPDVATLKPKERQNRGKVQFSRGVFGVPKVGEGRPQVRVLGFEAVEPVPHRPTMHVSL